MWIELGPRGVATAIAALERMARAAKGEDQDDDQDDDDQDDDEEA